MIFVDFNINDTKKQCFQIIIDGSLIGFQLTFLENK
jgi:hypothetical protein